MMNTITILTMLAILGQAATLSITGFSVVSSVVDETGSQGGQQGQPQDETGSISSTGNMTGGNVTEGNMTGSIVDCGPTQGQTC